MLNGGAEGADRIGDYWGRKSGWVVEDYAADWSVGKIGGPLRNKRMAEVADLCIAFWDGKSRGTRDMLQQAYDNHIPIILYLWKMQKLEPGLFVENGTSIRISETTRFVLREVLIESELRTLLLP